MKIKISSTTEKDVENFEIENWREEDLKHYGREVSWNEWKPNFFLFKAEVDGETLGVIGGHCIGGVLFIERIIVSKQHRGIGVGSKLINQAESYAKDKKLHKAYLYTGKGWESNKFYLIHGYKKTGEMPKHFMKKDFSIYSKDL